MCRHCCLQSARECRLSSERYPLGRRGVLTLMLGALAFGLPDAFRTRPPNAIRTDALTPAHPAPGSALVRTKAGCVATGGGGRDLHPADIRMVAGHGMASVIAKKLAEHERRTYPQNYQNSENSASSAFAQASATSLSLPFKSAPLFSVHSSSVWCCLP